MNEKKLTDIAVDILCITTIWGLLNNQSLSRNSYNTLPLIMGVSFSIYTIMKYI